MKMQLIILVSFSVLSQGMYRSKLQCFDSQTVSVLLQLLPTVARLRSHSVWDCM